MKRARLICLVALSIIGLILWYYRPTFVRAEFPEHGETYSTLGSPIEVGDRQDFCAFLDRESGFLLISGVVHFDTDAIVGSLFKVRDRNLGQISSYQNSTPYGLLQSSDFETGLFFELDPGENYLLRFGLHQTTGEVTRLRFLELNKLGAIQFAILVRGNGLVRMIGDGIDSSTKIESLAIACDNFRIAAANGMEGIDGSITVSISAGANAVDAERIINDYRFYYKESLPSTLYKWPLYSGVLLMVMGNPLKWRKK
jgi:hypothetical protein